LSIKYSIIVILLVYCNSLFAASELVYDKKEIQSFKFSFKPGESGDAAINNHFVREMARRNMSGLYETHFSLQYVSWITIQRSGSRKLEIQTILEPQNISGDIYYKEVNLADIFMPEYASYRVVVFSNGYFIGSRTFNEVRIGKNGFNTSFQLENKESAENYTVRIEDINFFSDQQDKTDFFNRTNFIDDYYASVALMNDVLDQFNAQKGNDDESMVSSYIRLFELNRVIRRIESSGFTRLLNARQQDVAGYAQKLTELKEQYERLETYHNYLLKSGFDVSDQKEATDAAILYVDLISRYFRESEKVTHAFSPYYFSMGKVEFSSFMKHSFEDGLKAVLQKSESSINDSIFITTLENRIYNNYLAQAKSLIKEEQFAFAKGILNNANSIYSTMEKNDFSLEMNMMISQADYGIYNSYIQVMKRAIQAGVFSMAETYIEKAWEFQRENKTSIITDNQIIKLQQDLIEKYLYKGDQWLSDKEYEEAVFCYNRAKQNAEIIKTDQYESVINNGLVGAKNGLYAMLLEQADQLFNKNDFTNGGQLIDNAVELQQQNSDIIIIGDHLPSMGNSVLLKMFDDLMLAGKINMAIGDFSKAYASYKDATSLKPEKHYEMDQKANQLKKATAEQLIISECGRALNLLNLDHLDEVIEIYKNCIKLAKENELTETNEVESSINLLDQRINDKVCQNLSLKYNEIFSGAEQYRSGGDYIQMIKLLDSCLTISGHNFSCGIDETEAYRKKAAYKELTTYQLYAENSLKALKKIAAQSFLINYRQMTLLSLKIPLIQNEIENYPLQNIFKDRDMFIQLGLILKKYDESEDLSALLQLLKALKEDEYTAKETEKIQEIIGKNMAIKDQQNIFNVHPRPLLKNYTNGENWFRFFENAYLQAWD
jgi:hypothetical protein